MFLSRSGGVNSCRAAVEIAGNARNRRKPAANWQASGDLGVTRVDS
jgi:hypothetical protein